jgi:hypothetical protein
MNTKGSSQRSQNPTIAAIEDPSRPSYSVSPMYILILPSHLRRGHYGPGVDSASDGNGYQESS